MKWLRDFISLFVRKTPRQPAAAGPDKLAATQPAVTPRMLREICESEGLDQPGKWPKADSGVTLGHGFDLGYCTAAEFREAWGRHLPPSAMSRLSAVIGLKALTAMRACQTVKDITVTRAQAMEVAERVQAPKSTLMHEFGHALEYHFGVPVNEEAIEQACYDWGRAYLESRGEMPTEQPA